MGIAFGTAVAVFREHHIKNFKGTYNLIKLADVKEDQPVEFPVIGNRFAQVSTENFSKIPGMPIAYWVSEKLIKVFDNGISIDSMSETRQGMIPGNTDEFLRLWYEVDIKKIGFDHTESKDILKFGKKWFVYNKGVLLEGGVEILSI